MPVVNTRRDESFIMEYGNDSRLDSTHTGKKIAGQEFLRAGFGSLETGGSGRDQKNDLVVAAARPDAGTHQSKPAQ